MARRILNIVIPALSIGILVVSFGIISGSLSLPDTLPLGSSLISIAVDRVVTNTGPGRLIYIDQAWERLSIIRLWVWVNDQISTSGISFDSEFLQSNSS